MSCRVTAAAPFVWAQCGAVGTMTAAFVGFDVAIWSGPWPAARAEQQPTLLGWGMAMAGPLVLVVLVCIMVVKLVVNVSREGFQVNAEQDDDAPAWPTTVVVTTTLK